MEKGTIINPVHVVAHQTHEPMDWQTFVKSTIMSIIPLAIIILMQKPAMRQAIVMRTAHYGKEASQYLADFFQNTATKCAQEYNKARM